VDGLFHEKPMRSISQGNNYASRGRHQSRDNNIEHQRDSGVRDVRTGEVQEEEAADGGGSSDEEEGGDPEPSSVPKEAEEVIVVRSWIATCPCFGKKIHYELGIDFGRGSAYDE